MSSLDELRQALHDLGTGPAPVELGDRALRRARRIRRARVAGAGLAVLAGLLAVPLLVTLPGSGGRPVQGGAGATNPENGATDNCVSAPNATAGVKQVDSASWPPFVRITMQALPARSDYVMQSGYDLCDPAQNTSNAYAVINLGPNREQGHLTVDLYRHVDPATLPTTCAALHALVATPGPGPAPTVLFCTDATATAPTLYGISVAGRVGVTAVYRDGRAVTIEALDASGPGFTSVAGSADSLRAVVTNPELAALLV